MPVIFFSSSYIMQKNHLLKKELFLAMGTYYPHICYLKSQ